MNGHPQSLNVALFIDADNASSRKLPDVLNELKAIGNVMISRAYGNWTKPCLDSWRKVMRENAVQAVQQFDLIKGKNATDMAMTVDVMDVLFTKPVDVFCLVSSDCDFTPLVVRLRAQGKTVIGCGNPNSSIAFAGACSRFIYLNDPEVKQSAKAEPHPVAEQPEAQKPAPALPKRSGTQLKSDTKLMNMLRAAIDQSGDQEGWAHLSGVGSRLSPKGAFCSRHHGYAKLGDMLGAIDLFELRIHNDHPQVRLRKRSMPTLPSKTQVKGA